MSKRFGNTSLTAAVVFAGLAISVSIVFVGMQLGDMGETDQENKKIAQEKAQDKEPKAEKREEKKEEVEVEENTNVRKIDLDYDHVRGEEDARITIIEYSDFECPYCQRAHGTFVSLVDDYDGKVNWVYRHFPLSFHEPAASAMSEASECAAEVGGNEKFWEYADALYEGKATGDDTSLIKLASDLGIDKSKFQTCIEADKYNDRIAKDMSEGADAGVNGTPGNFIYDNKTGKSVSIMGAQPEANFKSKIDALLKD